MMVHELSKDQCLDALGRLGFGRLGCALDGQPYVVPIYFYIDPESRAVYSFSAVGQKITWMRQNPKVCITADDITDPSNWTTIVAFGRYEELAPDAGADGTLQRAQALFQQRPSWWLPGVATVGAGHEPDAAVVFRIHLEQLTGRRTSRR